MASSLRVLNASRCILDSLGLKTEPFAKRYSTQRISSDEGMDDSPKSLVDEGMDEYFGLETLSLILKLWLRTIHLTEQDRRKNLQQFEHEIYITQEKFIKPCKALLIPSKSKNLDELLMLGHNDQGRKEEEACHKLEVQALWDKLERASHELEKASQRLEEVSHLLEEVSHKLEKACLKLLVEKEKVNFKMAEDDRRRLDKESVFVCSLLGLKLDFLDCLEETETKHRGHWTLEEWIVTLLQNKCASMSTHKKVLLNEELLVAMGFDPVSAAVENIIARAGMMQLHLEACEWPEIFVADEFKYNPLLSSGKVVKFPLNSSLTNEWFQLPRMPDQAKSEHNPNIMNLIMKELDATRITQTLLSNSGPADERNVFLFHGTDHQSAADILDRGIHLSAGRQKRDFSCGSGFYLTKSLDEALNWTKSTTTKPAILMFQVNREYFDNARKLNLFENVEKWQEIVSTFRSGQGTARMEKSLSKESLDLIEGPRATVRRSETCNDLVLEPIPFSYQMCLISDDFAEKFEQTLYSVLFLEMSG